MNAQTGKFKAVLFDLDGTLLDREASLKKFVLVQYQRFGHRLGKIGAAAYQKRFVELDDRGLVWKDKVYQQLLSECEESAVTWEELLDDYITNFSLCCVGFNGVKGALEQLKMRGYILGIISNGKSPFQEKNIEALGIRGYFSTVLISEKEGVKKPDSIIFRRALENLKINADEVVFIGDNLKHDIEGAKAVGMKAIWKKNGSDESGLEADSVFDYYDGLLDLIDTLT